MHPRQTSRELLEFAGLNYKDGRPFSDPVYKTIVEGRQDLALRYKKFYSSCADLAHWLLYRMGVRAPWVNRTEHRGWHNAKNVNFLAPKEFYGINPVAKPVLNDELYETGDILLIGLSTTRAHVLCVLDHDPVTGVLKSAEYGQPHGVLRSHRLVFVKEPRNKSARYILDRRVDAVLRLYDALNDGTAKDTLAEPETLAEYVLRFPNLYR